MIIATSDETVRFITQPDHAALAGQFAQHWAPAGSTTIEPASPVRIAAFHHDVGWEPYDRQPHLDDAGELIDFRDMPPDPWLQLYEHGIDEVIDLDSYAGLLVSLHGTGLRRRRYGLSPAWPETPPEYTTFVDAQETRQADLAHDLEATNQISVADLTLLADLHETGHAPPRTDSQLWQNYQRLQTWDTLSLAFCTAVSPPSYERIDSTPPDEFPDHETLKITTLADEEFQLEPYPFDTSPLTVTVPSRTIHQSTFENMQALRDAYYRATRDIESFILHRPA